MNNELTEIVCIVDRSGSMDDIKDDAIGGFNSFLKSQKAETGQARLSLVLFDNEYLLVHDGVDLMVVPELNDQTYVPRGSTALYDAIGRTIDNVGKRLGQTPEAERPGNVIVVILTDGYENASTDYSSTQISSMISHQQEVYSWDFIFLAANQDAIATAGQFSIPAQNAHSYDMINFAQSAFHTASLVVSERRRG